MAVAATLAPSGSPVPDQALGELVRVYGPYLKNHAEFDRRNLQRDMPRLAFPRIDEERLKRMIGSSQDHELPPVGSVDEQPDLTLSVTGVEGGCFDLSSPAVPRKIDPSRVDGARVRISCSEATLDGLLDRSVGVEQAIYAGLVFLEGESSRMDASTALLESFLQAERGRRGRDEPVGGR